jgi:Vps5 C terminal like
VRKIKPSHLLGGIQAERRALDTKQDFDKASRLVKTEVARFEQERIEDFRDSLQAFLSGMIDRQKQVCSILSKFLTHAR